MDDPDTDAPPLDDAAELAAWMIAQGWHKAVGPAAIDRAMSLLARLDARHDDASVDIFREALHRVKYRDGCPTCPGCGLMPRLLILDRQAFCGNDDCAVFMWNPSMADGGISNAATVDLTIHPESEE